MHPRPNLTYFFQRLEKLKGKVEIALFTALSAEFMTEVLKWIDGNGLCKHLFCGVQHAAGETDKVKAIVTGILKKDIEEIYAQVQERN